MFGTIRTLPSGKYQARYTLANGTQTSAGSFTTRADAKAALAIKEAEAVRGELWDDRKGRALFRDYVADYFAYREGTGRLAPRTLDMNRASIRDYLLPAFGHFRMDRISVQMVDDWWGSLPRAYGRRHAYVFLSKAMKYAVRWGYLRSSPCMVEGAFATESPDRPTFTVDDYRKVLANVREPYRRAFRVAFAGHLRLGELIALDRPDYDRRAGVLSITKQRTPRGEIKPTKTGQMRAVRLLQDGIDALAELPPAIGAVPLLTGAKGRRLDRHTLQMVWSTARAEAGLPGFHVHDLRHVGLSLLAQSGASLKDVQNRGGHASVAAAMRYQHTHAERDAEVAAKADALLA